MDASFVATCEAVKEAVWLKKFLLDLGVTRMEQVPITFFYDNSEAIAQSKDPINHKKGKHIEQKYHIFRDNVARGDVVLAKIEYGLITRGASLDLKSVTLIQAHLDKLAPDDVS